MARKSTAARDRAMRFVQVTQSPSMGVELSTGRAWVGIDRQVGHGSADALFALTDEQYAAALVDGAVDRQFAIECWQGEREDLLLFHPGGGSWKPEQWLACRERMIAPRVAGEVWWHIDVLGEPADGERVEVSRSLASGAAVISAGHEGVSGMTFRLVGDGAYPRPAALIAGLTAGSDREHVRAILGEPVADGSDEFAVEGTRVRLGYVDQGLVEITLERPATPPPPGEPIGAFLAVLGEPEEGPAFQAVARLAGDRTRRWAAPVGARREIAFDGGVEMQVEHDRVLSVRITMRSATAGSTYRHARDLIPGVTLPAPREHVRGALGAPVASSGGRDLHRYGRHDLLIDYGVSMEGETPTTVTAVLAGVSVSDRFPQWRSGDFTTFLDILGRESSNALVAHVRALPGVSLRMRGDFVAAVEIGTSGYQTERFAAFVDGLPAEPSRKDLPFWGLAHVGEHDSAWELDQGWVHAHARDGSLITSISISTEPPIGLEE